MRKKENKDMKLSAAVTPAEQLLLWRFLASLTVGSLVLLLIVTSLILVSPDENPRRNAVISERPTKATQPIFTY